MTRLSPARVIPLAAALLALAVGVVFISAAASPPDVFAPAAGRGYVLPLDDAYIHLHYARQTADGFFLRYNAADTPSTGATSLLWMLTLAAGFALGIPDAAMPTVAIFTGLILFPLAAALIADLARRAAEHLHANPDFARLPFPAWSAGLVAGAVFAGSGWMAWAYFSGMETGLLITLIIAALWAYFTDHVKLAALFASLAAITRPEAVLLGAALLAAWALVWDIRETNDRARRLRWLLMPFAALIGTLVLNWLLTGTASASGLQAKSWFTAVPFDLGQTVVIVLVTTLEILVKLFGGPALDGRWHALPLGQALALIGLGLLWVRGRVWGRRLALALFGFVAVTAAATATLQTATWHHFRYQMPLYPAVIVPAALALPALAGQIAGPNGRAAGPSGRTSSGSRQTPHRRRAFAVWLALIVPIFVWNAYTLADFRAAFAFDSGTVAAQQHEVAAWIAANLPEEALIAAHDVGTIRYWGGRETVDVVGLTSPGMAAVSRHGPGAIYEALQTRRPDYFAVYPDAAMPYFGIDGAAALLGEELHRVSVEPWSPNTSAGGTQVVTAPDWSDAALADSPQSPYTLAQVAGWTLVDQLDVADLADEAAHAYSWWHDGTPAGFPTQPRRMAYRDAPEITLTDGGRRLTGGESFTLAAQPGEWLLLVARLHQQTDLTLQVRVDDTDVGVWRIAGIPGAWQERAYLIPADAVRGTAPQITLTPLDLPPGAVYAPFTYWAYQGEPSPLPTPPGTVTEAAFGEVARLLGFDLPGRTFAAGDVIPLTLHWQALDPPQTTHTVFAWLLTTDIDAEVVAAASGQPRMGTYPFWAWREGEVVQDTLTLTIPADVPSGEYALVIGVQAADGVWLPPLGGVAVGDDRLALTPLRVR